jgi:hypothetical protein
MPQLDLDTSVRIANLTSKKKEHFVQRKTTDHVAFVVDRVALGQVFLPVLRSSFVNIIPPIFHAHSFSYHRHREIVA